MNSSLFHEIKKDVKKQSQGGAKKHKNKSYKLTASQKSMDLNSECKSRSIAKIQLLLDRIKRGDTFDEAQFEDDDETDLKGCSPKSITKSIRARNGGDSPLPHLPMVDKKSFLSFDVDSDSDLDTKFYTKSLLDTILSDKKVKLKVKGK